MDTKPSVSSSVEITLFDFMDKEASPQRLQTKKERILRLYHEGKTDIFELAEVVGSQPSYIGNVLMEAGLIQGYSYTTTSYDLNIYSKVFRNLLSFKTPQETRRCVEQLDSLYHYFERIGDRAGTTLRSNGSANRAQPRSMVWQTTRLRVSSQSGF